jgi:hypothetical protein
MLVPAGKASNSIIFFKNDLEFTSTSGNPTYMYARSNLTKDEILQIQIFLI